MTAGVSTLEGRFKTLALHAALVAASAIVIGPLLWIAVASLRTQISLMMGEVLFTPVLLNFEELLFSKSSDYLANYGNSLLVAGTTTMLVLVISTMAAYSLARLPWPRPAVHLILLWAVVFQMVPPITLVGAWFSMLRGVGLDASYTGLVLAHVTLNLPLALWMMTIHIREIPIELEEAARVDGATTPAILRQVIVPLARPGLAATAILVFIFSWNEFAVALNLTSRRTATIPVAVASFAQEYVIKHTAMAAAATLSLIPALLLLIAGQRYIVRGLTAGALK
jgi:multiple sugar transport system permease protein